MPLQTFFISPPRASGFTLLEALASCLILVILMTLGSASYTGWIARHRINNELKSLQHGLYLARSQAIAEKTITTLCPTQDFSTCDDHWGAGWMVFVDDNQNGQREPEDHLLTLRKLDDTIAHFGYEGFTGMPFVQYESNGYLKDFNAGAFRACIQSLSKPITQALYLNAQGRARMGRIESQPCLNVKRHS